MLQIRVESVLSMYCILENLSSDPVGTGGCVSDPVGTGGCAYDPVGTDGCAYDPAGTGGCAYDHVGTGGCSYDPAGTGGCAYDPVGPCRNRRLLHMTLSEQAVVHDPAASGYRD